MEITVSQLDNVTELGTVSAVSNFGIGFLTHLVTEILELVGVENDMLMKKIGKAKDKAISYLLWYASATPGAEGIMNLRLQLSGKSVLAYGTVYRRNRDNNTTISASNETPEI